MYDYITWQRTENEIIYHDSSHQVITIVISTLFMDKGSRNSSHNGNIYTYNTIYLYKYRVFGFFYHHIAFITAVLH